MIYKFKISVIIPVYNVEPYIERCARSLMEQTMKEGIEFIFINDCTPDGSMEVLQRVIAEYPERNEQVRIINHTENKGIAYTRGEGIREAKGEYIGWCDSDDWVDFEMYEYLYSTAITMNLDVVTCDYMAEYGTHSDSYMPGYGSSITACLSNLWKWNGFARCLWQQVMKKKLLEFAVENLITTNFAEDFYMVVYSYSQASTYKHISVPFYHYNRIVSHSLSTNINISRTQKDWEGQRANIERISCILCRTDKGKRLYKVACSRLMFDTKSEYYSAFEDRKSFYNEFKECYSDIMNFSDISLMTRIKLRIVFSSLFVYSLYSKFSHDS